MDDVRPVGREVNEVDAVFLGIDGSLLGALLAVVNHDLVVLRRRDQGSAVKGKVEVIDGFLANKIAKKPQG